MTPKQITKELRRIMSPDGTEVDFRKLKDQDYATDVFRDNVGWKFGQLIVLLLKIEESTNPKLNDNSDNGFPVLLKTDPRWPLVCENECPFEKECANAESAGDFRSEGGLTPDFVKAENGKITCYGCGEKQDGMRLLTENDEPTTYYDMYFGKISDI